MSTDMYNNFCTQHFNYYGCNCTMPYKQWYEGDSVDIIFNIEDIDDIVISEYKLRVSFYNFRRELIMEDELDCSSSVEYHIDNETSAKNFRKGVYYCDVRLVHYQTVDDVQSIKDLTTILSADDCLLYVK